MTNLLSGLVLLCLFNLFLATPIHWEMTSDSDGRMHLIELETLDDQIVPSFNPESDIVYRLCTREFPINCLQIQWNDMNSIRNSHFNPINPSVITIHGWNGDETTAVNWRVNERFLRIGAYNMINVDWSLGAGTINYITARNRVGPVALVLARFIDNLHSDNLIRFNDLIVVGTSLGGHIGGLAGKAVTQGRIHYIVGLDPAGPLFNFNDPSNRINAGDGVYVEIIHTNSGQLGIREPVGDVDVFPNFGRSQPGCENDIAGNCAHGRAINLFSESITDVFTATQCSSFEEIGNDRCTPTGLTTRMGGPVAKVGMNGIFHLTTNAQSPFSQG